MKLLGKALVACLLVVLGGLAGPLVWQHFTTDVSEVAKNYYKNDCNKEPSGFVVKGESREKLVIFVHGIFGTPKCTWTGQVGGKPLTMFEALAARGDIGKTFDMFTFAYPSEKFDARAFTLVQAAQLLRDEFKKRNFSAYKEVVLVAHSMGGLVSLEALTTYPELSNVSTVITLATPYKGAEIASLAKAILPNSGLRSLVTNEYGNDLLTSLRSRVVTFKQRSKLAATATAERAKLTLAVKGAALLPGLDVHCAYEVEPDRSYGNVIVTADSADAKFCDDLASPMIGKSHGTITTPENANDPAVEFVAAKLEERTKPISGQVVSIRRTIDYTHNVCNEGTRPYVEVMHDRLDFLDVSIQSYTAMAAVRKTGGDSVSLSTQEDEMLIATSEEDCDQSSDEKCKKLKGQVRKVFEDAIPVNGGRAYMTWIWKTADPTMVMDGIEVTTRFPISQLESIIRFPDDVSVTGGALSAPKGIKCKGTAQGQHTLRILCHPEDTRALMPAEVKVPVNFSSLVQIPDCKK